MIQRIQTVYLLVAAILMAVTAFSPLLGLEGGATLFSCGIESDGNIIYPTWGIVSMAVLTSLISFVAVFLFKNRKKQRTLTVVASVLVILYYVTGVVYLTSYGVGDICQSVSMQYGLFIPIVALVCLLLANRSIKKDEKLVKSLDRIR